MQSKRCIKKLIFDNKASKDITNNQMFTGKNWHQLVQSYVFDAHNLEVFSFVFTPLPILKAFTQKLVNFYLVERMSSQF